MKPRRSRSKLRQVLRRRRGDHGGAGELVRTTARRRASASSARRRSRRCRRSGRTGRRARRSRREAVGRRGRRGHGERRQRRGTSAAIPSRPRPSRVEYMGPLPLDARVGESNAARRRGSRQEARRSKGSGAESLGRGSGIPAMTRRRRSRILRAYSGTREKETRNDRHESPRLADRSRSSAACSSAALIGRRRSPQRSRRPRTPPPRIARSRRRSRWTTSTPIDLALSTSCGTEVDALVSFTQERKLVLGTKPPHGGARDHDHRRDRSRGTRRPTGQVVHRRPAQPLPANRLPARGRGLAGPRPRHRHRAATAAPSRTTATATPATASSSTTTQIYSVDPRRASRTSCAPRTRSGGTSKRLGGDRSRVRRGLRRWRRSS